MLRELQGAEPARPALPEEQQILARWSGWGALPIIFEERPGQEGDSARRWDQLSPERERIRELLNTEEWNAARHNTLNAHYTDAGLVAQVWQLVRTLGFEGGQILEPGCGSGNFLGFAPTDTRWPIQATGVELDPTTAAITGYLYPDAAVINSGLEDLSLPQAGYDLAIGNVPFGRYHPYDSVFNPDLALSIHDLFVIKALASTRPGGLVALITSRFTLDSADTTARERMYEMADMVGAVRLPAGAHLAAAGTDVVTDVLVFRRREEGAERGDDGWLLSSERVLEERPEPVRVNDYFIDSSPENVIGWLHTRMGRFGPEPTVTLDSEEPLDEQLADTFARIARVARTEGQAMTYPMGGPGSASASMRPVRMAFGRPEGALGLDDEGNFTVVEDGQVVPLEVQPEQREKLLTLIRLKHQVLDLYATESATMTPGETFELAAMRRELREAYHAYRKNNPPLVKPGQRRLITPKDAAARAKAQGIPVPDEWKYPTAFALIDDDPEASLLFGLEEWNERDGRGVEQKVLLSRVLEPRVLAERAETPEDAIALAMERSGGVLEMDEVARLLGVDRETAIIQVGTAAFRDPAAGGQWEARHLYLSGNVRRKLREAEAAAAKDPSYAINVAALTEVQPEDLTPSEIKCKIGAPWVPVEVYTQFLRDLGFEDPQVNHAGGSVWDVTGARFGDLATKKWGTTSRPTQDLFRALLRQAESTIEVGYKDIEGKFHVDQEATDVAREKAGDIAAAFEDWVWTDPRRAADLARIYNDAFNCFVLPSFDDRPLTLPGATQLWQERLRPHQNAAIRRILTTPTTLLSHVVGAGKTATMVCGAMELRRTGLAQKPAMVVPNHMLKQITREFRAVYPNAKLLAISASDLGEKKRARVMARIAGGEWDAVVLTHEAFTRVPMRPATQRAYMQVEVEQLRGQLSAASEAGMSDRAVKAVELMLSNAESRMKKALDQLSADGVFFEDTGIDYLFLDEAHEFKNLRTISGIPGAAILPGAAKATKLHMVLEYLRERTATERVATLATGTPIANSITEAYVLMRQLAPEALRDAGIENFDLWAATFGEIVSELEPDPKGDGYHFKARFARFFNVPELMKLYGMFADVQMAEDLSLPTPPIFSPGQDGQRGEVVLIPATAPQRTFLKNLKNQEWVRKPGGVLKALGIGLRASLDMRLVGLGEEGESEGEYELDDGSKLGYVAEKVAEIWAQTKDQVYPVSRDDPSPQELPGSLQIVFLDEGTPGSKARHPVDLYADLRELLGERGVPRERIRFIHEATTDVKKEKLFADCREGRVSVLVGSTSKMGTGTNVQDRAIALHHMSYPWRPADMAQRDGRIERQGNLNHPDVAGTPGAVRILYYVTERTFDEFKLNTLARKAKFISQVQRRDFALREIEDIGGDAVNLGILNALASGDPAIIEQVQARVDRVRLQSLAKGFDRTQDERSASIRAVQAYITRAEQALENMRAALPARKDTAGDAFRMTLDGATYTERSKAAPALGARLVQLVGDPALQGGTHIELGTLGGLPFHAEAGFDNGTERVIRLRFGWEHMPEMGHRSARAQWTIQQVNPQTGVGAVRALENLLTKLDEDTDKLAVEVVKQGKNLAEVQAAYVEAGSNPYREMARSKEREERLLSKLVIANEKIADRSESIQAADGSASESTLEELTGLRATAEDLRAQIAGERALQEELRAQAQRQISAGITGSGATGSSAGTPAQTAPAEPRTSEPEATPPSVAQVGVVQEADAETVLAEAAALFDLDGPELVVIDMPGALESDAAAQSAAPPLQETTSTPAPLTAEPAEADAELQHQSTGSATPSIVSTVPEQDRQVPGRAADESMSMGDRLRAVAAVLRANEQLLRRQGLSITRTVDRITSPDYDYREDDYGQTLERFIDRVQRTANRLNGFRRTSYRTTSIGTPVDAADGSRLTDLVIDVRSIWVFGQLPVRAAYAAEGFWERPEPSSLPEVDEDEAGFAEEPEVGELITSFGEVAGVAEESATWIGDRREIVRDTPTVAGSGADEQSVAHDEEQAVGEPAVVTGNQTPAEQTDGLKGTTDAATATVDTSAQDASVETAPTGDRPVVTAGEPEPLTIEDLRYALSRAVSHSALGQLMEILRDPVATVAWAENQQISDAINLDQIAPVPPDGITPDGTYLRLDQLTDGISLHVTTVAGAREGALTWIQAADWIRRHVNASQRTAYLRALNAYESERNQPSLYHDELVGPLLEQVRAQAEGIYNALGEPIPEQHSLASAVVSLDTAPATELEPEPATNAHRATYRSQRWHPPMAIPADVHEGGPFTVYEACCRDCDYLAPQRDQEESTVRDMFDHAHPGWRELLPVVASLTYEETQKKSAVEQWAQSIVELYPAGWVKTDGPVLTGRNPGGTRSHGDVHLPTGNYSITGVERAVHSYAQARHRGRTRVVAASLQQLRPLPRPPEGEVRELTEQDVIAALTGIFTPAKLVELSAGLEDSYTFKAWSKERAVNSRDEHNGFRAGEPVTYDTVVETRTGLAVTVLTDTERREGEISWFAAAASLHPALTDERVANLTALHEQFQAFYQDPGRELAPTLEALRSLRAAAGEIHEAIEVAPADAVPPVAKRPRQRQPRTIEPVAAETETDVALGEDLEASAASESEAALEPQEAVSTAFELWSAPLKGEDGLEVELEEDGDLYEELYADEFDDASDRDVAEGPVADSARERVVDQSTELEMQRPDADTQAGLRAAQPPTSPDPVPAPAAATEGEMSVAETTDSLEQTRPVQREETRAPEIVVEPLAAIDDQYREAGLMRANASVDALRQLWTTGPGALGFPAEVHGAIAEAWSGAGRQAAQRRDTQAALVREALSGLLEQELNRAPGQSTARTEAVSQQEADLRRRAGQIDLGRLRAYLAGAGWEAKTAAGANATLWEHPERDGWPIRMPVDTEIPDYEREMANAISTLATSEGLELERLLSTLSQPTPAFVAEESLSSGQEAEERAGEALRQREARDVRLRPDRLSPEYAQLHARVAELDPYDVEQWMQANGWTYAGSSGPLLTRWTHPDLAHAQAFLPIHASVEGYQSLMADLVHLLGAATGYDYEQMTTILGASPSSPDAAPSPEAGAGRAAVGEPMPAAAAEVPPKEDVMARETEGTTIEPGAPAEAVAEEPRAAEQGGEGTGQDELNEQQLPREDGQPDTDAAEAVDGPVQAEAQTEIESQVEQRADEVVVEQQAAASIAGSEPEPEQQMADPAPIQAEAASLTDADRLMAAQMYLDGGQRAASLFAALDDPATRQAWIDAQSVEYWEMRVVWDTDARHAHRPSTTFEHGGSGVRMTRQAGSERTRQGVVTWDEIADVMSGATLTAQLRGAYVQAVAARAAATPGTDEFAQALAGEVEAWNAMFSALRGTEPTPQVPQPVTAAGIATQLAELRRDIDEALDAASNSAPAGAGDGQEAGQQVQHGAEKNEPATQNVEQPQQSTPQEAQAFEPSEEFDLVAELDRSYIGRSFDEHFQQLPEEFRAHVARGQALLNGQGAGFAADFRAAAGQASKFRSAPEWAELTALRTELGRLTERLQRLEAGFIADDRRVSTPANRDRYERGIELVARAHQLIAKLSARLAVGIAKLGSWAAKALGKLATSADERATMLFNHHATIVAADTANGTPESGTPESPEAGITRAQAAEQPAPQEHAACARAQAARMTSHSAPAPQKAAAAANTAPVGTTTMKEEARQPTRR
jgi:N12 class adenine-specific DNA methylase